MPKQFQLVIHYTQDAKDASAVYLFDADEKYAGVPVPTTSRTSTADSVAYHEMEMWLMQQFLWFNQKLSAQENVQLLVTIKTLSVAFGAHKNLPRELAARKQEAQPPDAKANDSTKAMMERMDSYPTDFLTKKDGQPKDALQHYFAHLGVTPERNNKSAEYYLNTTYQREANQKLLHVRHCDHPFCSYNPEASAFVNKMNANMSKQVLKFMADKHPNKEETLFYGSFGSGSLLRDLMIISQLIKAGYKKFKFLFFDIEYASFCQQAGADYNQGEQGQPLLPTMKKQVWQKLFYKSIMEFSAWAAANLDTDNPVEIHIFSQLEQVERFFDASQQKLTLLVAEDICIDQDSSFTGYQTPHAHEHFMRVAKKGLDNNGCFFESIKDDRENIIYLHTGIMQDQHYYPWFTNAYHLSNHQTHVYQYTSLRFFTGANDEPEFCNRGKEELVYDESDKLISKKEIRV